MKVLTLIQGVLIMSIVSALVALAVLGGLITIVSTANVWYTEDGVMRKIKANNPDVSEIIDAQRNVFDYSVITVKQGVRRVDYCLDTNILWHYKIAACNR